MLKYHSEAGPERTLRDKLVETGDRCTEQKRIANAVCKGDALSHANITVLASTATLYLV